MSFSRAQSNGTELTQEPRLGDRPVTFDRGGGDGERVGSLFNGQTAEEPELDDAGLLSVELRESLERSIERDQIDRGLIDRGEELVVQRDLHLLSAALRR